MESETPPPQKCSCKCHKHAVAIFAVLLIAGVACWYIHHPNRPRAYTSVDPQPGAKCTVQFRRDMLGGSASLPISPTTISANGAIVAIHGELVAVSREAILLDQVDENYIFNGTPKMKRFWIPKNNILSIEYEPTRTFNDLPPENILRIEYEAKKSRKERTQAETGE